MIHQILHADHLEKYKSSLGTMNCNPRATKACRLYQGQFAPQREYQSPAALVSKQYRSELGTSTFTDEVAHTLSVVPLGNKWNK
jgi:hypothetical protein